MRKLFLLTVTFCFFIAAPVVAAEVYGPPTPRQDPFTVDNVQVDVSAPDAVQARDQAIIEARKKALGILASRFMNAEQLKDFKMPDDAILATLVQDFEIKREQIALTRYAAEFKVRFTKAVTDYVPVEQAPPVASASFYDSIPWEEGAETEAKNVLVLPYFETSSGKTLLWEEDNRWLKTWQDQMPSAPVAGRSWKVPLGDISDLAAGSSDGVWSGDYTAIETLQKSYGVDEVILAVASLGEKQLTIDVYVFANGGLSRRQSVTPFTSNENESDAFISGMKAVLQGKTTRTAQPVVKPPVLDTQALAPAPEASGVQALLKFKSAAEWIALQKKLRQVNPPVKVQLLSMTSSEARFFMGFDGSVQDLSSALLRQNMVLGLPTIDIDSAIKSPPVYEIRIMQ